MYPCESATIGCRVRVQRYVVYGLVFLSDVRREIALVHFEGSGLSHQVVAFGAHFSEATPG